MALPPTRAAAVREPRATRQPDRIPPAPRPTARVPGSTSRRVTGSGTAIDAALLLCAVTRTTRADSRLVRVASRNLPGPAADRRSGRTS